MNGNSISLDTNIVAYKNRALYYLKKKDIVNACNDLKVAKELGGYHITKDLIDKYCKEGE
ncbi:MAG: hypothetical protein J7604_23790 [Sporocytophaga sp.]|uniref:hypothetical protein n=1 Tax=Sporocytophaga sp. TaxID=2231183 RepID=UPI001B00E2CE|nr:hypothetical protein [Sporocytophaga sp.]MBO9703258.1 hypothetical protein [Sporocytophaga sp.]